MKKALLIFVLMGSVNTWAKTYYACRVMDGTDVALPSVTLSVKTSLFSSKVKSIQILTLDEKLKLAEISSSSLSQAVNPFTEKVFKVNYPNEKVPGYIANAKFLRANNSADDIRISESMLNLENSGFLYLEGQRREKKGFLEALFESIYPTGPKVHKFVLFLNCNKI